MLHLLQVVAPSVTWCVPAGHLVHVSCPSLSLNVLAAQTLQVELLIARSRALALPGGHGVHVALLLAPYVSLHVPAPHASKVMLTLAAPTFSHCARA